MYLFYTNLLPILLQQQVIIIKTDKTAIQSPNGEWDYLAATLAPYSANASHASYGANAGQITFVKAPLTIMFKVIILMLLIDLSPRRNSAIQTTEPNSHIQYLAMRSRGCGSKDFPYKIFTLL